MSDLVAPKEVADFLLYESRERGEVLTNLKLQKLLYYAQAWFLALEGCELFSEDFQAWVHGPVLPSQYHRFKEYTWRPVTEETAPPNVNDAIGEFLNEIIDEFGSETAIALELMTHREKPWIEARDGLPPHAPSNNQISKATMAEFYSGLAGAN